MKIIFLFFLFVGLFIHSYSQVIFPELGKTYNEVIAIENYKNMGVVGDCDKTELENSEFRLHCSCFRQSGDSGVIYFDRYIVFNSSNKCYGVLINETKHTINTWVKLFNKNFVKISEFEWKDYDRDVTYKITTKEENIIISSAMEF